MTTKAGIWIDHKHAVVIRISESGQETSRFAAGVAEPFPPTNESRAKHEYTKNDFAPEVRLQRKQENQCKEMFEQIETHLKGVQDLLILGPGEAKNEFESHLQGKHGSKMHIEVETADKLTEPQLVARTREHEFSSP